MADEEGAYYLERILFAHFTLFLQLASILELKITLEDDFKMYFCFILPKKNSFKSVNLNYVNAGIELNFRLAYVSRREFRIFSLSALIFKVFLWM